jgi:hypothetical protein
VGSSAEGRPVACPTPSSTTHFTTEDSGGAPDIVPGGGNSATSLITRANEGPLFFQKKGVVLLACVYIMRAMRRRDLPRARPARAIERESDRPRAVEIRPPVDLISHYNLVLMNPVNEETHDVRTSPPDGHARVDPCVDGPSWLASQ